MGLITKETAWEICKAYREIEAAKTLLEDLKKAKDEKREPNFRDPFGRKTGLELGVPMDNGSHRLFNVEPNLAIKVIESHILNVTKELEQANLRASVELEIVKTMVKPKGAYSCQKCISCELEKVIPYNVYNGIANNICLDCQKLLEKGQNMKVSDLLEALTHPDVKNNMEVKVHITDTDEVLEVDTAYVYLLNDTFDIECVRRLEAKNEI